MRVPDLTRNCPFCKEPLPVYMGMGRHIRQAEACSEAMNEALKKIRALPVEPPNEKLRQAWESRDMFIREGDFSE